MFFHQPLIWLGLALEIWITTLFGINSFNCQIKCASNNENYCSKTINIRNSKIIIIIGLQHIIELCS
ncbi:unnamed protein product [Ceutorhynchus assimilis]|uniref:Uncharacterized protein n=1 Tax=Ceutorhynchus assimilis TaxID=467358 RepID=A0A9N9QPL2_9CUCU|nr:unnamed protein product [Ceutorhynchus assimilis]